MTTQRDETNSDVQQPNIETGRFARIGEVFGKGVGEGVALASLGLLLVSFFSPLSAGGAAALYILGGVAGMAFGHGLIHGVRKKLKSESSLSGFMEGFSETYAFLPRAAGRGLGMVVDAIFEGEGARRPAARDSEESTAAEIHSSNGLGTAERLAKRFPLGPSGAPPIREAEFRNREFKK